MRYVLLLLILISFKANAFELFTYHDWCELKLNTREVDSARYRAYTLKKYKQYKEDIKDCRKIPYLSNQRNQKNFELALLVRAAYGRNWKPLDFVKEIPKIDKNPNYFDESPDNYFVTFSGAYGKKILGNKIKAYQSAILESSCYSLGTIQKIEGECKYFDYINLLGEKSFGFFEEIYKKTKKKYLSDIKKINAAKEKRACRIILNVKFARIAYYYRRVDYKVYKSNLNLCDYLTGGLLMKKPSSVLSFLDDLYNVLDAFYIDKKNVLKKILNSEELLSIYETSFHDKAISDRNDFKSLIKENHHFKNSGHDLEELVKLDIVKDQGFFDTIIKLNPRE